MFFDVSEFDRTTQEGETLRFVTVHCRLVVYVSFDISVCSPIWILNNFHTLHSWLDFHQQKRSLFTNVIFKPPVVDFLSSIVSNLTISSSMTLLLNCEVKSKWIYPGQIQTCLSFNKKKFRKWWSGYYTYGLYDIQPPHMCRAWMIYWPPCCLLPCTHTHMTSFDVIVPP